jgi:hypothetical protein
VRVRKYDGSTETEIALAQSEDTGVGYEASPVAKKKVHYFPITIPQTHFKRGDILRVTLECWSYQGASAGNGTFAIAHDPMNRDGNYIKPSSDDPATTTQFKIEIPFRLDEVG